MMLHKAIIAILSLSFTIMMGSWIYLKSHEPVLRASAEPVKVVVPLIKYGMDLNQYKVVNHIMAKNERLYDILSPYNVSLQTIDQLSRRSKDIFNLSKIKTGNNFVILADKSNPVPTAEKLIYEESKVEYVIFNLKDSVSVAKEQNKVEHKRQEISGVIRSSLYETFQANHMNPVLAIRMSEIYAWSVDFYKVQPGDKFKIIYDEDFVDGQSVNIGKIYGCVFNSGGKDFYALYYEKDPAHSGDYFDENGNSMKKQFLKAPVKFSYISSPYSLNRFHPVTKEWKAHLGTDYAAATGTPIMATADGVVEDACFKEYNGNYVKIRHNGQYKTQYLHMSKIAKGMHPGARVKQGDIIGYVGMTGLATGPSCLLPVLEGWAAG